MVFKLGTYEFSPQSFSDNKEENYDQVNIIGGKPTVQSTGDKLKEISFEILLDANFCDPEKDIDTLEKLQSDHEVLRLINGEGKNYGNFVIVSTPRQHNKLFKNGHIWSTTLTLNLLEYNSITDISVNAPALSTNSPVSATAIMPLTSPALDIDSSVKNGKMQFQRIDVSTEPSKNGFTYIKSLAQKAQGYYQEASTKIQATTKIYYRAKSTVASLSNIKLGFDDMINACNINSFNALVSANNNIKTSLGEFDSSYATIIAFIASREGGN